MNPGAGQTSLSATKHDPNSRDAEKPGTHGEYCLNHAGGGGFPKGDVNGLASPRTGRREVAITGGGMSSIGRRLMRPPLSLTVEACERAVADAGLTMADIDGLSTYPGGGTIGAFGEGGVTALEAALGIRPTWYNGGMETFGPGGSVIAAMLAGWTAPFGATSAAHTLAQNAQRHFHKYGTTRETLGWIALNQRANAALNPTAIYRSPLTMDEYLAARMVTTPFGLYDCDVPCDASVAVIVSSVDAAGDMAQRPVYAEAVGTQILERIEWDQSTLTHEPQVLGPAAHLDGGKNIARDGLLPLNTHGGQLSHGRTHGIGLVHEAIVQLRGDGGPRQVPDAKVAVVSCGGLTPSGVLLLRADA
jgi:acetyl-CoA acetyltransferase